MKTIELFFYFFFAEVMTAKDIRYSNQNKEGVLEWHAHATEYTNLYFGADGMHKAELHDDIADM